MELLTPHFGLFAWTLIAFLIILFILKKFAWKPILSMLNERETKIAQSIAAAENMKKEIADMKAENDILLAQAREERSQILKEAKEAKDRIINEAKDKAKDEAAKIISDANAQILQSKNKAITEVKNQIGLLTIGIAEKVIKKNLSSDKEQQEYIQQLTSDIHLN